MIFESAHRNLRCENLNILSLATLSGIIFMLKLAFSGQLMQL